MTPTDHGPSPRSRIEARRDGVDGQRAQPLEVERPAEPDERCPAPRVEARAAAGRQASAREQVAAVGGVAEPADPRARRADDRALEVARSARLDQLAAERAEQRVGDGRHAQRPQPAQLPDRSPSSGSSANRRRNSEWSSSSASDEAEPLDCRLGLRADDDRAARQLPGVRDARRRTRT